MLFDRREPLEVALHARRELVALRPQQPQLRLLAGTRALLPRAQSGALADPRPLGTCEHDHGGGEQADEDPAHPEHSRHRQKARLGGLGYSRAMPKLVRAAVLAVFAAAFYPSAASAADQTIVLRSAAITVPGYGVNQAVRFVPSPQVDGYVTGMSADVVDESGVSVPISSVMLHHVVFAKLGAPDATCSHFVDYDGRAVTASVQRFYAEGEERSTLPLPAGYGYPNKAPDRWGLVYMLMNHKPAARTVYVQYTVRYTTGETLTPVRPYWLDVRNCRADPIFDVPGGGALFSTYSRSADFTMPESGRIVAAGGHLHGGGLRLELSDRSCGTRLFTSEPTWGLPVVKPIIHEPGPKHMTTLSTANGIPVAAGDKLRMTATYENSLPHSRVMGIMMFYLAPQTDHALRAGAGPPGRPAQPSVRPAPLHASARATADRAGAARAELGGLRLRLRGAARRRRARIDLPLALRRAVPARRHARERAHRVLVPFGLQRSVHVPVHEAGRVPAVLLAAPDGDDPGRHRSFFVKVRQKCGCHEVLAS